MPGRQRASGASMARVLVRAVMTRADRRRRKTDRPKGIRLQMLAWRALGDRSIITNAGSNPAIGMPISDAAKLLRPRGWRKGGIARLEAAARQMELDPENYVPDPRPASARQQAVPSSDHDRPRGPARRSMSTEVVIDCMNGRPRPLPRPERVPLAHQQYCVYLSITFADSLTGHDATIVHR